MAMRPPKITVGRVYLKPFMPEGFEDKLDPDRILNTLKRDILKRIKKAIQTQDTFSDRAKTALAKALKIEIQASSVRVTVNHPAWRPMVLGRKEQQMSWLVKSRSPIPIVTDTGKVIFRSATPKTMADGKWVHPGYQKTDLIEKARKDAREYVREKVAEQIRAFLRRAAA